MADQSGRRRDREPFTWYVNCGMPALGELAGVPLHLLFRDADAIIHAYRVGVPRVRELFGPDVEVFPPGWAHITYGHVNTLGCELVFPEDSDVGHVPIYGSLDEGIRALREDIDFARSGTFPFYLELWGRLKEAFGEREVPFGGLEAEGPITTAWLLRGHDFFLDIYDDREGTREFLDAVTESIIRYKQLVRTINGQPGFSEQDASIADDVAAMIHPDLWPELVVPYLERYYRGVTSGRRLAHIEGLSVDHLKYLDELSIDLFDPSVSPRLTPALLRDNCRVPFHWRLSAMDLRDMSEQQIAKWVSNSVADGAAGVFFHVERITCDGSSAAKVRAFIGAAKQVKQLLDDGRGLTNWSV